MEEEAPPQSLSHCHHAPEALARWQGYFRIISKGYL